MLERFDACHKHARANIHLREIQAGVVVDRVTVLHNNKVWCACQLCSLLLKVEVVRTEPENG